MNSTMRVALAAGTLTVMAGCKQGQPVELEDANNYYFLADITADAQTIPAYENSQVDWSGLTIDLLGRDVDPAELDIIRLIRFTLTQEEVIEGINYDNLRQADVSGNADYEVHDAETGASLTDFFFLGSAFPPEDELQDDPDTYLMSVISETESGGEDYRIFTFVDPITGAKPATVSINNDSASLAYDVDLQSVTPISFEDEYYVVDWAGLTQDAADLSITLSNIDTIMLAQYDTLGVSDLEADFLALEDLADRLFFANVEGKGEFDLMELSDEDGQAFTGFEDGTWLIALRCGSCISPAPLFLGVVQ